MEFPSGISIGTDMKHRGICTMRAFGWQPGPAAYAAKYDRNDPVAVCSVHMQLDVACGFRVLRFSNWFGLAALSWSTESTSKTFDDACYKSICARSMFSDDASCTEDCGNVYSHPFVRSPMLSYTHEFRPLTVECERLNAESTQQKSGPLAKWQRFHSMRRLISFRSCSFMHWKHLLVASRPNDWMYSPSTVSLLTVSIWIVSFSLPTPSITVCVAIQWTRQLLFTTLVQYFSALARCNDVKLFIVRIITKGFLLHLKIIFQSHTHSQNYLTACQSMPEWVTSKRWLTQAIAIQWHSILRSI